MEAATVAARWRRWQSRGAEPASRRFAQGRAEQGRKAVALSFDLYWSFRSPYSYIALPRVAALARDFAVEVGMRVVHPAAIRNPAYFRP